MYDVEMWLCNRCDKQHTNKQVAHGRCSRCGHGNFHEAPSPRQIARACAKIQAGWTELEEYKRRFGFGNIPGEDVCVDVTRVSLFACDVF